ncbi:MAG TPA: hypothetical protein DCK79_06820 [Candidatus Atribacteria bacterium]|nr:MAG: hypothetical protein XD79_0089 [Atribacteria bacterium 34_128]HAJ33069.1 hypothetical protein [Candidatus Atribacteria bacterium]
MKEYFENLGNSLSLKDKAYENIKLQIVKGNLKPGERLLEEKLSKVMKISRAPIREAFNRLEKEGFVTIIPRKGAVVSNITTKEIENIFEIREAIEPLAARKSFSKLSITELDKIGKKFEEFINKHVDSKNRIQYSELDEKFHIYIVKNCDNEKIIELLSNFEEHVRWFRAFYPNKSSFNWSIKEHLKIIDAIKNNDRELFIKRLIQHLRSSRQRLLSEIEYWRLQKQNQI